MHWPWSTIALTAAVVAVQADLWLGRGNMPQVLSLTMQLAQQEAENRVAAQRNERAGAELADLKEGLEMVEEKARRELGMVKADEILVQYTTRGPDTAVRPGTPFATGTSGAAAAASAALPSRP
jgi:cell division protein FtsB